MPHWDFEICISQILSTDFTVQHPTVLWTWHDARWKLTSFNCLMLSETMVFLSGYKSVTEQKVVSIPISKQVICLNSPLPLTMLWRGGRPSQRHSIQCLILIWGLRGPKTMLVPSCTRAGASTVRALSLIASKSHSQKCAGCRSSGSSGQSKSNFILCELQMQFLLLHPGKSTAAKLSSHGGFTKVIF